MNYNFFISERLGQLMLIMALYLSIFPLWAESERVYALQIVTPVTFPLSSNLLASDNGTLVIRTPDSDESLARLNDGDAMGGWQSATALPEGKPLELILELPEVSEISTLLIQPQNDIPGSGQPDEVELLLSVTENPADFNTVGRFNLRRKDAWQLYTFVPHTARYVVIRIVSVYGSSAPGIGEIAAFAPGAIFREPAYYFSADPIGRVEEKPEIYLPTEHESPPKMPENETGQIPIPKTPQPEINVRVRHAQELLGHLGFKPGPADGMWGRRTGIAVMRFQGWYSEASLKISGELDDATYIAMQTAAKSDRRYTPPPKQRPIPVASTAPKDSITGIPKVLDTGTLSIRSFIINLLGVNGAQEPYTTNFSGYIRAREVNCTRQQGDEFKCFLGDVDLSELVLLNGAARAKGNAPEYLKAAEQKARDKATGIWQ